MHGYKGIIQRQRQVIDTGDGNGDGSRIGQHPIAEGIGEDLVGLLSLAQGLEGQAGIILVGGLVNGKQARQ